MSVFKAIVVSSRIWKGFRAVALSFALALYIAGSTGYGLLHQHSSQVSHSIEEENDPCHKAIYHVEQENACEHGSHISKKESCCDCHLLFHSDQIIFRNSLTHADDLQVFDQGILIVAHPEEIALYHPSRGPPSV
jgi:hypothetical protein